ncbi:MAG: hypothetical protein ACI89M_000880 [Chitinophagales bacterium]|jgi:hypothetical protein
MRLLQLTLILSILFLASCEKDPVIPNEEELITTLNFELIPIGGGATVSFTFQDLDGDGGDAPIISGGILSANESYVGTLVLLNETENPADNISLEVEEEGDEHQFFFQSTLSDVSVAYNDQDVNGNPIGLSSTLTTANVGTGSLTITLRHEPNKFASGVSNGALSNAGGETDIEVTFPFDVQ